MLQAVSNTLPINNVILVGENTEQK